MTYEDAKRIVDGVEEQKRSASYYREDSEYNGSMSYITEVMYNSTASLGSPANIVLLS